LRNATTIVRVSGVSGAVPPRRLREMSVYQKMIGMVLRGMRRPDVDPRHVEGWMRLTFGTLDGLGVAKFADEVRIAVDCCDEAGIDRSDDLARSYGLMVGA
jgi:hypothetical protein